MKIIFLNTWSGKVRDGMAVYLQQQALDTDIFCFQEAGGDMLSVCDELLQGYEKMSERKSISEINDFSQATYIKKGIPIIASGTLLQNHEDCGLGLYVEIEHNGKNMYICNIHGMSRPVEKLDNPSRILQSKTLLDFFESKKSVVIGGDFNLLPDTESIQMFEQHGYSNLIKDYEITNTRNHYVWDRYPDTKQYYSDYIFISPDFVVERFMVPDNEISDHLPLELTLGNKPSV